MPSEQLAGWSTGRGTSHPSHPRDGTCRPSGFTSGKLLKSKCFLTLPTEKAGCYLLLLFVYIKKQVNIELQGSRAGRRGCVRSVRSRVRSGTCGMACRCRCSGRRAVGTWGGCGAHLSVDYLAPWAQALTAPASTQLGRGVTVFEGLTGKAKQKGTAGTLEGVGAPGWDRTSNPCLRSFGDVPGPFINQDLAQLANCKTKVKQGGQRSFRLAQGEF